MNIKEIENSVEKVIKEYGGNFTYKIMFGYDCIYFDFITDEFFNDLIDIFQIEFECETILIRILDKNQIRFVIDTGVIEEME